MKDWVISLLAAIAVVGLVVWCVHVFIVVLYG
jgi:hypothetical protein